MSNRLFQHERARSHGREACTEACSAYAQPPLLLRGGGGGFPVIPRLQTVGAQRLWQKLPSKQSAISAGRHARQRSTRPLFTAL